MTLAVSLSVPDGLVIAADSLSTTMAQISGMANISGRCPNCQQDITLKDISMPPIPIPTSVSSFAQKIFPFMQHYGIATYGLGILNEKTIYYHVRLLEKKYQESELSSLGEISNGLMEYFDREIRKQIRDMDQAPGEFIPLGFIIVGYDGERGKRILVRISKKPNMEEYEGSGCTIGGDIEVVNKLWELGKADPRRGTKYASFSLQDAIDYAEYLISSSASFQRFANMIPTIGGEVDIGLITPFRPFSWIKCKSLTKNLEKEYL